MKDDQSNDSPPFLQLLFLFLGFEREVNAMDDKRKRISRIKSLFSPFFIIYLFRRFCYETQWGFFSSPKLQLLFSSASDTHTTFTQDASTKKQATKYGNERPLMTYLKR